jgi:hypothetical protein
LGGHLNIVSWEKDGGWNRALGPHPRSFIHVAVSFVCAVSLKIYRHVQSSLIVVDGG